MQSQVLRRKEGDDKITIFPGTKSLAQKRAALRRIKWSLSAHFSLGQQENLSLYINMLGSLRERLEIIFGLQSVPCIFCKKQADSLDAWNYTLFRLTFELLKPDSNIILFCGCYTFYYAREFGVISIWQHLAG